jgi:hypothetical protein
MNKLLVTLQESSAFDYATYVDRFQSFVTGAYYVAIVNYWNKRNNEVPVEAIQEFDWLYDQYFFLIEELHRQVSIQKDHSYATFELLEFFADVKMILDTVKNLPKYLRVSTNFVDVFEMPVEEYFVQQGDTLESIAVKFYGDAERYTDIADFNSISYYEVGATGWVGRILKVPLTLYTEKTKLAGIVDGQIGKAILGKDVAQKFSFVNNDIATVAHEDCFVQSMFIMLGSVPRSSVPEYPTLGTSLASIVGKNIGSLSMSLVVSDLQALFNSDPTFSSVRVVSVAQNEDAVQVKLEFASVLRNVKHSDVLEYTYKL